MKILKERENFSKWRAQLSPHLKIGLVPTMGNLHLGHLSLIEKSIRENDQTIVTIFVNPKQFGPNEDFSSYPRTLEEDIEKLKSLEHFEKIILFAPNSEKDIYPDNFSTTIEVHGFDNILCDQFRPGHFKGVTTVVYQIFTITRPSKAYFGQKDIQQFKIIQKMTNDLCLPIQLEMCPIYREESGLALSSRNQYLTLKEKGEATLLYQALEKITHLYKQSPKKAIEHKNQLLKSDPRFQYIEILDQGKLKPLSNGSEQISEEGAKVVAGAFILGDTRLIDNIIFK